MKPQFSAHFWYVALAALLGCSASPPPAPSVTPGPGATVASSPPAGPITDCSVCTGAECVSAAGQHYCASPVSLDNPAGLDANVGRVVSLRGAELGYVGASCTAAQCDCCNNCGGGWLGFVPAQRVDFRRSGRVIPQTVRPLQAGTQYACESHKSCETPRCPIAPGVYDAVGTLRASDRGWDLELLAISPSTP